MKKRDNENENGSTPLKLSVNLPSDLYSWVITHARDEDMDVSTLVRRVLRAEKRALERQAKLGAAGHTEIVSENPPPDVGDTPNSRRGKRPPGR